VRLPKRSAAYGTNGSATIDPTDIIEFRRPSLGAVGWS
jgi:hypothetical protein